MIEKDLKSQIMAKALELGAELVGFAPASRWDEYDEVDAKYRPQSVWPKTKSVIVLGVPILLPMLETTPSINYSELYKTTNILLDQIAYRLSVFLLKQGHQAIFFPRDAYGDIQVLVEKPCASFSHVFAAKYAGLGTIGYNHTLLNEVYGPRVRYVSVFTDAELAGDPMIERDLCIHCHICEKLCPSQAFSLQEGSKIACMNKKACSLYHVKLKEEYRYPCGVCIKVCPIGQDRSLYERKSSRIYLEEKEALAKDPQDEHYQSWVHARVHGVKGERIY